MARQRTMAILGAGYAGKAVARLLAGEGWRVRGSTRERAGAAALEAAGIEPFVLPGPELPAAFLSDADALLVSAPPQDQGDLYAARLGEMDAQDRRRLGWIGYLSTTGVYGDTGGAWVDETAPTKPGNARGRRRVLAEGQWFAAGRRLGVPTQAFRLPGIYGPGRSALDDVRAGRARRIDKPGQVFSRIHVEDIARAIAASLRRPDDGAIYNVCDDLPAPSADVVAYACELLGVEPPAPVPYAEIEPSLSPMAREFYADCRRVCNARLKRELGVALAYPDYRAGLRAIAALERA